MKLHPGLCAALAALSLGAGAARAGDGDCVWRSLTPGARAAVVASYRRHGLTQAKTFSLPTLDLQTMGAKCVRDGADLQLAIAAAYLAAMKDDVGGRLHGLGVDPALVRDDWKQGLSGEQRAAFRDYLADRQIHRPTTPREAEAIDHILTRPHLEAAIQVSGHEYLTKQAVLDYDFALARMEELEAQF